MAEIDTEQREPAEGEKCTHDEGEKCDMCLVAEAPSFAGGAQTFAEYDDFVLAAQIERDVTTESIIFEDLSRNVMRDETLDLADKAGRIKQLATELQGRVASAQTGQRGETKEVDGQDLGRADFADQGEADKSATWTLPLTHMPGGVDQGHVANAITALEPGDER
ncbi:hypothetical protein LCGC14_1732900, partial [marine sediment metagenome]